MDLVNRLTENRQAFLLVLPKADMITNCQQPIERKETRQLVLMQLPSSLSSADFKKAGNCRFLASTTSSSSFSSSQSCCLVVESQGSAFDLVKVETSNSLVMLPPSYSTSELRPLKKPKITDVEKTNDVQLVCIPSRLLQAGGSGASFLELRPKPVCLGSLRQLLQQHHFDPYNQNNKGPSVWQGRTVDSLALELLVSQQQIIDGLRRLQSLALFKDSHGLCFHGFLAEEALLEAQFALVSTLAECDEFERYATTGIPLDFYIEEAMKRMNETYPYLEQVMRHCIQTSLLLENEHNSLSGAAFIGDMHKNSGLYVRLDVKKVATIIAKQLFLEQTDPWEEQLFLSRWRSNLPGVGADYDVSIDLLRGLAIRSSDDKRWKYFGTNQLPLDPGKRFHALFRAQEVWSFEELMPYLQPVVEETNFNITELLQQNTKIFMKESQTGETVVCYTKK